MRLKARAASELTSEQLDMPITSRNQNAVLNAARQWTQRLLPDTDPLPEVD
jgi:hypothetical protein